MRQALPNNKVTHWQKNGSIKIEKFGVKKMLPANDGVHVLLCLSLATTRNITGITREYEVLVKSLVLNAPRSGSMLTVHTMADESGAHAARAMLKKHVQGVRWPTELSFQTYTVNESHVHYWKKKVVAASGDLSSGVSRHTFGAYYVTTVCSPTRCCLRTCPMCSIWTPISSFLRLSTAFGSPAKIRSSSGEGTTVPAS